MLEPVIGAPGLWRAPGVAASEAGVHALIIGISAYPYMSGGTLAASAQSNYGMGQLLVSAKTAAQIFDWVLQRDEIAGQRLLSCRVLLAPQAGGETSAVQALTRGHYGTPSFDELAVAIKAWSKEFLFVDPAKAKQNVSFFVFSGHGLEHLSSPSLVPLDFLAGPGQAGLQNLIAINGMRDALKTYNLGASFYFIDACRNAPPDLMKVNPVGDPVLKPLATFSITPDAVVWLQATTPGAFAYQPSNPDADGTFFGKALLEGLTGVAPDWRPYQLTSNVSQLFFSKLEIYVKNRTPELLASINPALRQLVRAGGDPYEGEIVLAEAPKSAFSATTEPPVERNSLRSSKPFAQTARKRDRFGAPRHVNQPIEAFLKDAPQAHRAFGHEWITDPLIRSLQIVRTGPPAEEPRLMDVRVLTRPLSTVVAMDFLLPEASSESTLWISAGGPPTKWPRFVTCVPFDNGTVPLRLELVLTTDESHDSTLAAFTAEIAPLPTRRALDRSAQLWGELWQLEEMDESLSLKQGAGLLLLPPSVEGALLQGLSPLAATIAGFKLRRGGVFDQSSIWPKRTMEWHNLVEGAVLWADVLWSRADRRSQDMEEICEALLKIDVCGAPRLSAAFEAAVNLTTQVSEASAQMLARLEPVAARLAAGIPFSRVDGVFMTFGPLPADIDLGDLISRLQSPTLRKGGG
ncbi:caspase family protein [Bradyrhizobium sp. CW4]|uniref:caspase family protein n=2 Tax=unclassified Bradyrhizobium TaxID=2631580 RepID=UPI001FFB4B17|nr:caspase family protein [Bradyrhizobium sp. CW4]MCK1412460.1 caspase family protein [Bradyrhizobium sp. CW4]